MLCFVKTKLIMKHTSEQMQLVIKEWQASGLSKKEFSRQRNITYQTFHYWCKRLISAPDTGFTEIRVQGHERAGGSEIVFPSGARMVFHGEPSANWLRELLR
jgi:hypothetical protein